MDCERHDPALSVAALGGVTTPELAAHLAECGRCRAVLGARGRFVEHMDATIAEVFGAEPSRVLVARVRQEAAEARVPAGATVSRVAIACVFGALAATALVAWWRGADEPMGAAPGGRVASAPAVPSAGGGAAAVVGARGKKGGTSRAARIEPARLAGLRRAARDEAGAPAVLVERGQDQALERWRGILRDREVELPSLAANPYHADADLEVPELRSPADVSVPPLEVEPLLLARLESDHDDVESPSGLRREPRPPLATKERR